MNSRPNETQKVQELYDAYASSDENYGYGYDGDDDAYEGWPEDDSFDVKYWPEDDSFDVKYWPEDDSFDVEVLDESSLPNDAKLQRSNRRRADARAKKRFFETAAIAAKNLRARLSHADRHPNAPIPKYQVAKRLLSTAQKMGMDI